MKNKIPTLEFTGERYLPEVEGKIQLEHLHRYAIAKELVAGKLALDIACGEGYGCSIIASTAKSVIGVDISKEAIEHAQSKYNNENIEFRLGSCSSIPLDDNSIDIVISFETIEHHDQHEAMMAEIKRVLTPQGVLLISSPNKLEYSDIPGYSNPYHVKELYRDELINLISNHFTEVEILNQGITYSSTIISDNPSRSFSSYINNNNDIIKTTGFPHPMYDIAVASNSQLPALEHSMFLGDPATLLTESTKHIATLCKSLDSVIADRDSKSNALEQLQDTIKTLTKNSANHITQLSNTLESVISDRDAKNDALEQRQDTIKTLTKNSENHITQLSNTLESVISDRDAKNDALEQLQDTIKTLSTDSKQHITQLSTTLESVIVDRDAKNDALEQLQDTIKTLSTDSKQHITQLSTTLESVIVDRDAKADALKQLQNIFEILQIDIKKHITPEDLKKSMSLK